jgi:hypothetical protein
MKKGTLTGRRYLTPRNPSFVSVTIGLQNEEGRYLMHWIEHGGGPYNPTGYAWLWEEESILSYGGLIPDETEEVRKLLEEYE